MNDKLHQLSIRHEADIHELHQQQLAEDDHTRVFRQFGSQLDCFYNGKARDEISDIASGVQDKLLTKVGRRKKLKVDQHLVDFLEDLPLGSPEGILQKSEFQAVSTAIGSFVNLQFQIPPLKTQLSKQKFKEQIIREDAELNSQKVACFHVSLD